MDALKFYQAMGDATRLRLVNLLRGGPLCVCHLQEILGEPQVKVSKHLAVLKAAGAVVARREANWMIYSLPAPVPALLAANLSQLETDPGATLAKDASRLAKLRAALVDGSPVCEPASPVGKGVLRPTAVKTTSAPKLKISR